MSEPTRDGPEVAGDERSGTRWGRWGAQALLAGVALIVGVGLAWLLYQQKTAPGRIEALPAPPVVRVVAVMPEDVAVRISGYGTVEARRVVQIVPQVSGRVVSVHPELTAGGFLPAGQIALEIDPTDYQLALEQAEAAIERVEASLQRLQTQREIAQAELAQARTRLEVERAEQEIALWQYRRMHPEVEEDEVPDLAARRPQLREAEAVVSAARARLGEVSAQERELLTERRSLEAQRRQAQVQVARTVIRVPEGSESGRRIYRVMEAEVAVGQVVGPQQAVAGIYEVDGLEVSVPLEDEVLRWVRLGGDGDERGVAEAQVAWMGAGALPGRGADGSRAVVRARYAGEERTWAGRVVRMQGRMDPRSQLVNVVIGVEEVGDPTRVETLLVPGMFVEVEIEGETAEEVFAVPADALRAGGVVYVSEVGRVAMREVEIVRRDGDEALVRGLRAGDRVIVTPMEFATEGMRVRMVEDR